MIIMRRLFVAVISYILLITTTASYGEKIIITCPSRSDIENRKYLQNEFVTTGDHGTIWHYRGTVGDFASAGREITNVPKTITVNYISSQNRYEFVCNNIFRQRYMLTHRDRHFSFYSTAQDQQGKLISNRYQCKTTQAMNFECELKPKPKY